MGFCLFEILYHVKGELPYLDSFLTFVKHSLFIAGRNMVIAIGISRVFLEVFLIYFLREKTLIHLCAKLATN